VDSGSTAGCDETIVKNAAETGKMLLERTPGAPPIFTLKHLSQLTGVNYSFLRRCVERVESEPYRRFRIRKRQNPNEKKQRYRIICVPDPRLMAVHRWINTNILQLVPPHAASVAFGKGNNIAEAAANHCASKWLIKLDIVNFFESISEQSVYHVFSRIGYQPLIAFELARLCTRLGQPSYARWSRRWSARSYRFEKISSYQKEQLGHLPQGAPTSPMLANLSMTAFDASIRQVANDFDLAYTRYADDLTFSTTSVEFNRNKSQTVIPKIYAELLKYGFKPNLTKTKISSPGSRKVVLGLLVDGAEPRLTKKFRDNIRQHLYFINHPNIGPVQHANKKGFKSIYGLRNHVQGLIAHASQIDKEYANAAWEQFNHVLWP
jgi:retron-type reverse transcriptase